MLLQKTVIINDKEVSIQQLGGGDALEHSIILGQLFGGFAQGVESQGKESVQDWNIDFGKMIDGILSNLDSKESPKWIKQLIRQSMIRPEYSDNWFDTEFSGNIEGLLDFLKTILEHNYGGLLEYARKKIEGTFTSEKSSKEKKEKEKKPGQLAH